MPQKQMYRKTILFLCLLSALVWVTPSSQAQVTTGTILGTVEDGTGAIMPGVKIMVRNTGTGISRTVFSSNTEGGQP